MSESTPPESDPLSETLPPRIAVAGLVASAVGLLHTSITGMDVVLRLTLAATVLGFGAAYAVRRGDPVWTMRLNTLSAGSGMLAMWFRDGGSSGPAMVMVSAMVAPALVVRHERAFVPRSVGLLVLVLTLFGVEWMHPELIHRAGSVAAQRVDQLLATMIGIVLVFVVTHLLRTELERRAQRIADHADALERGQAALEEAAAAAQRANEAKSLFLARMSHELRTPLTGMLGAADVLDRSPLDPAHRELVGLLARSGRHLQQLIDELLDLGSIESGRAESHAQRVSPRTVARDVMLLLETTEARGRGVVPVLAFDPDLPERLELDGKRLRQVLVNLVGNAMKYATPGDVIVRIVYEHDRERLRLEVEDEGPGIAESDVSRIFEPFQRLVGNLEEGRGLGLYVTKRLVESSGGTLDVETRLGSFTRFVVRLPAVSLEVSEHDGEGLTDLSKVRVLSAEDDPTIRMVLGAMFDTLSVHPTFVENGTLALAAARRGGYDVVFLDVHMPELDGLAVARALHAEGRARDLVLVALTANAYPEDIAACREAGMHGFLAKPVDLLLLEQTLVAVQLGLPLPARVRV